MNPNHKQAMEVVDSVARRELDRSFQASRERREPEKEKTEKSTESKEAAKK